MPNFVSGREDFSAHAAFDNWLRVALPGVENGGDNVATGFGEVVTALVRHLLDQTMGAKQTDSAAHPKPRGRRFSWSEPESLGKEKALPIPVAEHLEEELPRATACNKVVSGPWKGGSARTCFPFQLVGRSRGRDGSFRRVLSSTCAKACR